MKALTLGPSGTYSHRAARAVADEIEFAESVTDIVERVATGATERGVIPIENSIEGSVTESLNALEEFDVAVVLEILTPIQHALIGTSEEFDLIASHTQALAQCHDFLEAQYPNVPREAVSSTAQGVERAHEDPSVAAIGHPETSGDELQVIAEEIQDRSSNTTRFVVIAPPEERSISGGKTSLIVYPNTDHPGLLLALLEPFADENINLSRIESRPTGDRLGDYLFHIDIGAGLYEDRTENALAQIEAVAEKGWVKRLGSYDTKHVLN